MSDKGYINIDIYPYGVHIEKMREAAESLNEQLMRTPSTSYGWCVQNMRNHEQSEACIHYDGEARWLEEEISDLKGTLLLLEEAAGISRTSYRVEVGYTSYEEPDQSGALIELTIENGKISKWLESVVTMVEGKPWFCFDMENG